MRFFFISFNNWLYSRITGTGKTATFSISILQKIDTNAKECQALILAPTRELAQQVSWCLISDGPSLNYIECCSKWIGYWITYNQHKWAPGVTHLVKSSELQSQRSWVQLPAS